jgi:hypothetical protein
VTEEQRRQTSARALPEGLPIFAAAAALLVGQRSMKDIFPSHALPRRQISGNALVPYLQDGFKSALGAPLILISPAER